MSVEVEISVVTIRSKDCNVWCPDARLTADSLYKTLEDEEISVDVWHTDWDKVGRVQGKYVVVVPCGSKFRPGWFETAARVADTGLFLPSASTLAEDEDGDYVENCGGIAFFLSKDARYFLPANSYEDFGRKAIKNGWSFQVKKDFLIEIPE